MIRRFSAQQPVRWLSPTEILRGASGEFFGGLFGKYADNRDRQDLARPKEVYRHPSVALDLGDSDLTCRFLDGESDQSNYEAAASPPADYVVDYVADVGDGFGATFAIAELMARKNLTVTGSVMNDDKKVDLDCSTTRGSLLVMGGDQVYPVANEVDYDNRTVGPYVLAYQLGEKEFLPVYAIPGNHDWYDGLASFLQIFTNNDGIYRDQSNLLSVQSRSYFAVALPHGWWLWGIDTGLSPDARLDLAQTQYFRKVSKLMKTNDRVILAIAEPFWIKRRRGPKDRVKVKDDWDYLVDFLSRTLTPDSQDDWHEQVTKSKDQKDEQAWLGRVRLILSGDKHFYVRHQAARSDLPVLISSGGGGAYTSSTWEVAESVTLNREPVEVGGTTSDVAYNSYRAEKIWPPKRTSLLRGILGLLTLPPRNPRLAAVVGGVYALFTYAFVTGQIQPTLRPGEGAGRLNVALERFDGHCAGDLATIASRDCVRTLSVDLTQGTLNSFASSLIAAFIIGALYLFASAGWNERLNDPLARVAATFGAAVFHTVLHAAALGVTVVTSVAMVIQLPSEEPVRFERVWIPWLVVSIATLIPVLWPLWRHKVRDLDGLWVLAIPAFFLGMLHWLGSSTDLVTAAVAVVLAAAIIGGALGTFVLTVYMVASQFVSVHLNELFVGLRSEDYKQFLRLRMTEHDLTIHSIGYKSIKPRTVKWDGNEPRVVRPIDAEEPCLVDYLTIPRDG